MSARLPAFKPRDLVALLKRAGFQIAYQDSSHLYLRHPGDGRTTCVPMHPGDVKRGLAHKILFQDCGLTLRELQRLL
jgi:predicted RNA binding protein YcfA (HicA-like mRNA interferase family)